MYDMFNKIRREGPNSVENDIEAPDKSKFFAAYPEFVKDHHLTDFVCDTMRIALMGGVEPFDVDQMIEADMDVHAHLVEQSVTAISTVADALAGVGDRCCRAGGRDDYECAWRATRGDRQESGRGAGGHISGNPDVLRHGWADFL